LLLLLGVVGVELVALFLGKKSFLVSSPKMHWYGVLYGLLTYCSILFVSYRQKLKDSLRAEISES
jgi:uncharacterized membrane protein YuzA (DUF378 family)